MAFFKNDIFNRFVQIQELDYNRKTKVLGSGSIVKGYAISQDTESDEAGWAISITEFGDEITTTWYDNTLEKKFVWDAVVATL